ncbi:MAG: rRNA maturation RNase YbeY [Edaphocola sp.]
MAIHFYEVETASGLKQKRKLVTFLNNLAKEHLAVEKVNVAYVFCTDAYLLEKNLQFLQHDTYTDIITFDLSTDKAILEAEIYISVERIRENAQKFSVGYQQELHRVIFHGMLHLCGFKDKKQEDKETMTGMENKCLAAYLRHEV